jgi:hypothetical protein
VKNGEMKTGDLKPKNESIDTDICSIKPTIRDGNSPDFPTSIEGFYYRLFDFHLRYTKPESKESTEEQGILIEIPENAGGPDIVFYIKGTIKDGMAYWKGLASPDSSNVPEKDWHMERKKFLGYIKITDLVRFEEICDSIQVPGKEGIAVVKGKRLPPLKKTVKKWARLWTLNGISELKYHGVLLERP